MTALAVDTHVYPEEDLRYIGPFPVAADTLIYQGAMVAINSAGYAVPASASTTLTVIGHAKAQADNSGGSAGAVLVTVDRAPCRKANSDNDDEITNADLHQLCYVVDDDTVARTSNDGARPVAGIVRHVGTRILVEFDSAVSHQPGAEAPGGVALDETLVVGTDFTAANTTETIDVGDLPPGVYVGWTQVTAAVAGGSVSAATLEVGWSGNNDAAIDGFSVFATSGLVPRVADTGTIFVLSATTTITATLTTVDDDIDNATAGTIRVMFRRIGM